MHLLLVGFDEPLDGGPALQVFPGHGEGILAELADVLRPLLDDGDVVVIHPTWDDATRRAVDSLHAALDRTSFLRHGTSLPPLAANVLGSLASRLAPRFEDASRLVAALPRLENRILAAAVLDSVAHLEHLQPNLRQHMASWVPGGRFFATAGREPSIERIRRKAAVPIPPLVDGRGAVIAVGDEGIQGPVRDALTARGTTAATVQSVELSDRSAAWWGTRDVVEIAIFPVNVEQVYADLDEHVGPVATCGWCGRDTPTSPCPRCGHVAGERLAG